MSNPKSLQTLSRQRSQSRLYQMPSELLRSLVESGQADETSIHLFLDSLLRLPSVQEAADQRRMRLRHSNDEISDLAEVKTETEPVYPDSDLFPEVFLDSGDEDESDSELFPENVLKESDEEKEDPRSVPSPSINLKSHEDSADNVPTGHTIIIDGIRLGTRFKEEEEDSMSVPSLAKFVEQHVDSLDKKVEDATSVPPPANHAKSLEDAPIETAIVIGDQNLETTPKDDEEDLRSVPPLTIDDQLRAGLEFSRQDISVLELGTSELMSHNPTFTAIALLSGVVCASLVLGESRVPINLLLLIRVNYF